MARINERERMRKRSKQEDQDWRITVDHTRRGAMAVIRSIQQGEVDEVQLEMLNNFVLFSLALMQMEGPTKWARAKLNAEIMSLNQERINNEPTRDQRNDGQATKPKD